MLQISDLCCGYGDMTVIRDINFELEREGLLLVGSNGAGKTTLLMSLAGHII